MRAFISQNPADDWILHCEDYWYFLCTFTALLQCGKRILLTQNISEAFIAEVKKPGVEFLTDQNAAGSASIQEIIEKSDLPDEQYKTHCRLISILILTLSSSSSVLPRFRVQSVTV